MPKHMQLLLLVLAAAGLVGGITPAAFSGGAFSIMGAIIGATLAFTVVLGLGAYFHRQDKKRSGELPDDVRAAMDRMMGVHRELMAQGRGEAANIAKPERAKSQAKAPVTQTTAYSIGDMIAGKYAVIRVLGGGMGTVYVVDHEDDRFVLKTIKAGGGDLETFASEARTWVSMGRHENIVSAQWVDWIGELLCVAADYVPPQEDGRSTLRDCIRSGAVSVEQILRWGAEFSYAMEHALSRGLVAHRDIKPENLMLGRDGRLLVTDFGISAAMLPQWPNKAPGQQAIQRATSGTPAYMAPEQWRGEAQDFRTDVYAFGMVMFEAAFSAYPWQCSSTDELRRAHLALPARVPDHPLAQVISRALTKNPDDRFSSPQELRAALATVAETLGIPLPPTPIAPDRELDELMAEASLGHFEANMHRATAAAQLVTERWLDFSPGWTQLGRLWLQQDQLAKAFEATKKSLDIDPTRSAPWNNLGLIYAREERVSDAEHAYLTALKWDPANTGAMSNLANLFALTGKTDEAIALLEKAVRVAPDKHNLWLNLGSAYQLSGDKDRCLVCLRNSLGLAPAPLKQQIADHIASLSAPLRAASGVLNLSKLVDDRKFDTALPLLEKLKREDPDDPSVWYNLARCYRGLRRDEDERKAWLRLFELDPTKPFAANGLLSLAKRDQDWPEALRWCDELARHSDRRTFAIAQRARVHAGAGDKEQARKVMLAAIQEFPRSVVIRETFGDLALKAGAPIMANAKGYRPALQLLENRKESALYRNIRQKSLAAEKAAEEDRNT